MSRVAKRVIDLPAGVTRQRRARGASRSRARKGALTLALGHGRVGGAEGQDSWRCKFQGDDAVRMRAGATRAHLANMVHGRHQGLRAQARAGRASAFAPRWPGKALNLTLGFSHPVSFPIPEGITIETPSQTEILIKGNDRQQVGQTAAEIRDIRPPEPYKGKGVRYSDEQIILKEGKKK